MRIKQLPDILANQIAAGEVIERPASVIKELLENAMDALADTIQIEVDYGGLSRIKVSDNGTGIMAADLPLAIAAHATSKISTLDDLYALKSLGFRGEALASIASIAQLTICSKPESQAHAVQLLVKDGQVSQSPSARQTGTTVEVIDLFYNAPVRKKFLKAERTEFLALESVVKRFALSNPGIALSLMHNHKLVFELPAAACERTIQARIKKLMGKAFVDNAVHFEVAQGDLKIQGWASNANYQRSQNDKQWHYLNLRMVKDKLINHAVKQAYESILHPGRFPACLLYLTVPEQDVDVNVHPTKHEVRFCQPRLVHDFIVTQLSKAIGPSREETTRLPDMANMKSPLVAVHEPPSQYSLHKEFNTLPAPGHWQILNHAFFLVMLNERPFLVDMNALQQHIVSLEIEQSVLPLAERPLLLPVHYILPPNKRTAFFVEAVQKELSRFGMQVHLISEDNLVVRSIPQCLPNLHIQELLDNICALDELNDAEIKRLLPASQPVDVHQLDVGEQQILVEKMQSILQSEGENQPWCKPLSEDVCRRIVYG